MTFRPGILLLLFLLVACASPEQQPVGVPPSSTTVTSRASTITTSSTVATTTSPATTLPPLGSLAYETVATDLPFPIVLTALPGDSRAVLATKDGRLWWLDDSGVSAEPILDIADRVTNDGEQGLLGVAIHPDDPSRLFVHYSDVDGATTVSEFTLPGDVADPAGERVLLSVSQPAVNHNGGMIQFGPDGFLYLGLGDGGGANDRFGNGQNPDTLLAGLVRIDVETGEAVKVMSGLRNPWRFWIDGETVVFADVGQNAFEEVSMAPLGSGANFGWPITEGLHCFAPASGCDTTGLTLPIVEVAHGDGGACSITGGVVYRGTAIPELDGRFLFSDYCGGWLRSVDIANPSDVIDHTGQVGVPGQIGSFGIDGAGEVYVLTTTSLLKLVPLR